MNARLPSLSLTLGVSAVLAAAMLLLQISDTKLALFYWLNALSHYTGELVWAHITLLGEGLLAVALVKVCCWV